MSNQITVDSFVIEMSLQETVLKGLQKLEKQIMPIATRMEKTLNKTFSKDYSKGMSKTFSNIEKRAQTASRNINRSLTDAFRIGNAGNGLFRSYEQEGRSASRNVARMMHDAYRTQPRVTIPPLTTAPRNRPPANMRDRINTVAERARTSSLYGRLQLRDDGSAERYNSRLQLLQMQHTASENLRGFQSNLRRLNFEFSNQLRVASQARASQRLAAMESSNLGSAFDGISSAAIPLVGALMSVQKAVQFFRDSIEEGAKRQQAATMATVAYGSKQEALRMTIKADEVANQYGLDTATVRQQMAQMRMTMLKAFDNDKLAKFFGDESVFAHTTGMNNDAVYRLNYAIQQIAASPKLNGQDWLQVVNASPALVSRLADTLGVKDSADVKAKLKTMKGSDIAELMMKAMQPTPEQVKMAQHNILAARGRMYNAEKYAMDKNFRGFSSHLSTLYDSLASSLNNSGGLFERGGQAIGWFIDRLNDITKTLDNIGMNVDGYLTLFEEKWDKFYSTLSPSTQKALDTVKDQFSTFFDWLLVTATAALGLGGLKLGGRLLGVGRAAGSTAEAAAEGGATSVMGSTAGKAFGIAAAAYIGVELGELIFDKWVPEFQKFAQKEWGWGGKDGTETTHEGNTLKDSPVDWLFTKVGSLWDGLGKGGLKDPALAGYNPYAQQSQAALLSQKPIQFAPLRIEVVSNGQLNVALPDGTIKRVALDTINQQHELQMMSATGLAGSWQSPGNNAGWNPSLLKRK
ncbi:tape measure protein [Pantoea eucalypti]|uniref:tape measure protein n=1 Tax=Pantoea eucalypti TaxID=470933 RepID=UPI000999CEA3|nr:tape measure protein [Pantoea eucalypti]SJZ33592.1 tape measure domain-containing protein [Pantoea eucalypti]